jgi:hypothetical protein
MNPQHNGDPRFRITYLNHAKEQFRQIVRRALHLGRLAEVVAATRLIHHRLQTDPREFGESIGSYRFARLDLRDAAVGPVVVHYGVHQDQHDVFVRGFDDLL